MTSNRYWGPERSSDHWMHWIAEGQNHARSTIPGSHHKVLSLRQPRDSCIWPWHRWLSRCATEQSTITFSPSSRHILALSSESSDLDWYIDQRSFENWRSAVKVVSHTASDVTSGTSTACIDVQCAGMYDYVLKVLHQKFTWIFNMHWCHVKMQIICTFFMLTCLNHGYSMLTSSLCVNMKTVRFYKKRS